MCLLSVIVTLLVISTSTADITSPITYTLLEEGEPGVLLGVIPLDSGLTAIYGGDVVQQMTFTFTDEAAPHIQLFDLDNNGVLTTMSSIDRDVMCEHQPLCTIELSIRVQSDDVFHILQAVITIEDINDNAPVFSDRSVSTSLSEASAPGSMFTVPAASDPDSPQYTISSYHLVTGAANFRLVANNDSQLWTQEVVYLFLLNNLDREEQHTFTIQLMAVDGSGQSDTLTVDIHITDVNDNNPMFVSDRYSVTVDENLPSGSRIAQVEATDPDDGDNGIIRYRFSTKTETDYGSVFSLDPFTGEVFTEVDLDYEVSDSYVITISAENINPGSLPDITQLTVHVNDINDNAPDIRLITDDEAEIAHIPETKAPGSFVAHIRVTDKDSLLNGQFECELNHPMFALQQIYNTEYKIITKQRMDREQQERYDLWVYCKDKGETPQTSSEYITILIDDDNDNSPSFSKQTYTKTVRENSAELTLIQVLASDPDKGENGRVALQLEAHVADVLYIDEDTGIISAMKPLDREQLTRLSFNVIAHDHGKPEMTSSVQVVIVIDDEDDNDPIFPQKSYMLNVNEHLPPYSEVGQVLAVDADSDLYNKFTYSLKLQFGDEDLFAISPSNGTLYTLVELDRAKRTTYTMSVITTSYGTRRPVTSGAMVTIIVGEVNDFKPLFTVPNGVNNTFIISEDIHVGEVILTLEADDKDVGESGEVKYAILSGNEDSYIHLFEDNGTITVNRDLHDLDNHLLTLVVRVQDGGVPLMSSKATLTILVNKAVIQEESGLVSTRNLTVVVIIGCISGVVLVILLVTVAAILRRRHIKKQRNTSRRSMFEIVVEQKASDDCSGSAPASSQGSLPRRTSSEDKKQRVTAVVISQKEYGANTMRSSQPSSQEDKALVKIGHYNAQASQHHRHKASLMGPAVTTNCDDLQRYRLMYGNQQHLTTTTTEVRDPCDKDSDSGCSADMSRSTDGLHNMLQDRRDQETPQLTPVKPSRLPTQHMPAGVHRLPPPYPRTSSRLDEEVSSQRSTVRRPVPDPNTQRSLQDGQKLIVHNNLAQHKPQGSHPHRQTGHPHPLGPPPPYVPRNNKASSNNVHKPRQNPPLDKSTNSNYLFVGNLEEVHV